MRIEQDLWKNETEIIKCKCRREERVQGEQAEHTTAVRRARKARLEAETQLTAPAIHPYKPYNLHQQPKTAEINYWLNTEQANTCGKQSKNKRTMVVGWGRKNKRIPINSICLQWINRIYHSETHMAPRYRPPWYHSLHMGPIQLIKMGWASEAANQTVSREQTKQNERAAVLLWWSPWSITCPQLLWLYSKNHCWLLQQHDYAINTSKPNQTYSLHNPQHLSSRN